MAHVLVVDDDADGRDLLARLLRALGHRPDEVAEGAVAIEHVMTDPPDLVFLDVMMPELDGFHVLETLRAEPATARVPVVMYTAYASPDGQEAAVRLGAQGYLIKGIATAADIEATVDRLAPA
ncbi:MAG TPA: response regulator [Humisphaera sp.]